MLIHTIFWIGNTVGCLLWGFTNDLWVLDLKMIDFFKHCSPPALAESRQCCWRTPFTCSPERRPWSHQILQLFSSAGENSFSYFWFSTSKEIPSFTLSLFLLLWMTPQVPSWLCAPHSQPFALPHRFSPVVLFFCLFLLLIWPRIHFLFHWPCLLLNAAFNLWV